jgi:O-antigen/teichoic acid export membrane protein
VTRDPTIANGTALASAGRRSRVTRAVTFEVVGFGSAQLIRFASNVVLSRLVSPDTFGMAALVFLVLQGFDLFSDIGIGLVITRSERGDDESFLNSIWTLQVLRGFGLFAVGLLLASPIAHLYDAPSLSIVLMVAATQSLIAGFNATSLQTFRRHMMSDRLVAIEIAAQLVSVTIMLAYAYRDGSVWAMIAGSLAGGTARLVASHVVQPGRANRIRFDRNDVREVLDFGRWVLGSSAVYFAGRQGDRLLLAHYLGFESLGLYSLAIGLSDAIGGVVERISHNVIYPMLSRSRSSDRTEFRRTYYRMRLYLDFVAQPLLGALFVLGQLIVDLIWDDRYSAAGWMVEALSIKIAMNCALSPCDRCLLALGNAQITFYRSCAQALWISIAIPIAHAIDGVNGIVVAASLRELPVAAVLWPAFRRTGMLSLRRELVPIVLFAAGAVIASIARFAWSS